MIKLSVVLISKNQAWNIPRLIESVFKATSSIPSVEVALVDSFSTDKTVQVASNYPVTVLRLHPHHLTPAAGRYMGYKYTSGDLILFLDGDMELCVEWLDKAMRVIEQEPGIAVITGKRLDLPKIAESKDTPPISPAIAETFIEIPYTGGAAMFKRSVLEKVGAFNPYLYSDEEPEVCIRIRSAGYRIVQLQTLMVYHYTDPPGRMSTLIRRWQRNLYLGAGQNLRYHLGTPNFFPYLKERGYGLIPGVGLLVGLVALVWAIFGGNTMWFGGWLLLLIGVIFTDTYRKKSLYRTLSSLLERLLILDGTVRGFLLKPVNPQKYPEAFDIIQRFEPGAEPYQLPGFTAQQ